jgi:hypothetical protein
MKRIQSLGVKWGSGKGQMGRYVYLEVRKRRGHIFFE